MLRAFAQSPEVRTVVFDWWSDLTSQFHKMMDDQAHDMKAIGHDLGVGERASDQVAIRAGKIDTHNAHLMAPLKPEDKAAQIGFTAPCNDIKHSMVLEIAQSGGLYEGYAHRCRALWDTVS